MVSISQTFNEGSYRPMSVQFHTLPRGATSCTAHRAPSAGPACPCAQPLESLGGARKRQWHRTSLHWGSTKRASCTDKHDRSLSRSQASNSHFPHSYLKQILYVSLINWKKNVIFQAKVDGASIKKSWSVNAKLIFNKRSALTKVSYSHINTSTDICRTVTTQS